MSVLSFLDFQIYESAAFKGNSVSEMSMESKKGFLLFLMEIQALMVKSY